jgi:hypothetical protein
MLMTWQQQQQQQGGGGTNGGKVSGIKLGNCCSWFVTSQCWLGFGVVFI